MTCEMCGAETKLVTALVEGVELKVCKNCAGFGKVVKKPIIKKSIKPVIKKPEREIVQMIVEDYPKIIRNKREKMGLKQKELAKFLAERESLIHKMESGTHKPSLDLARKLEKQLNINLIEQKEIKSQSTKTQKKAVTIGDLINIKK